MKQQTLSRSEKFGKTTRRAQFLEDMDRIIPWAELAAAMESVYPKPNEAGGRPPIPLERMLRIFFLQTVVQPLGSCRPRRAPSSVEHTIGVIKRVFGFR